jgi:hypothetical protein
MFQRHRLSPHHTHAAERSAACDTFIALRNDFGFISMTWQDTSRQKSHLPKMQQTRCIFSVAARTTADCMTTRDACDGGTAA